MLQAFYCTTPRLRYYDQWMEKKNCELITLIIDGKYRSLKNPTDLISWICFFYLPDRFGVNILIIRRRFTDLYFDVFRRTAMRTKSLVCRYSLSGIYLIISFLPWVLKHKKIPTSNYIRVDLKFLKPLKKEELM